MLYTVKWDDDLSPTVRHHFPSLEGEEEGVSWEAIIEEIVNVFEQYGMPHLAIFWMELEPDDYFSN